MISDILVRGIRRAMLRDIRGRFRMARLVLGPQFIMVLDKSLIRGIVLVLGHLAGLVSLQQRLAAALIAAAPSFRIRADLVRQRLVLTGKIIIRGLQRVDRLLHPGALFHRPVLRVALRSDSGNT